MIVLMMDKKTADSTAERLVFTSQFELSCFKSPGQSVVCGEKEIILVTRKLRS